MRKIASGLEMINKSVISNEEIEIEIDIDIEDTDHTSKYSNNRIYIFIQNNYDSIYGGFLHIYCIIVFEIIFYFNYITAIEKKEILKVIKTFATNIKQYDNIVDISTDMSTDMEKYCNLVDTEFVNKQNSELQRDAYNIIWGLSLALVVTIAIHCKMVNDPTKLMNKTMEAFITIVFIILFEFIFFTNIVEKYNTISNNEAICYLLETINDKDV